MLTRSTTDELSLIDNNCMTRPFARKEGASNSQMYLFTSAFFLLIPFQHVSGIPPPDFESAWLLLQSQSAENTSRTVEHGLGEVPLKVKVLAKPIGGPYEGWTFEAITSQQADDDLAWTYCGLLYLYDHINVYLASPNKNNGHDGGRAFCIDSNSWTSGPNTMNQVEQEVLAKIIAWKESSFPVPDFDSDWINVTIGDDSNVRDVAHGLNAEPDLVQLQIHSSTTNIYAEGVGAGSTPPPTAKYVTMVGLIFAYNKSHIRVWNPNDVSGAGVIGFGDGYPTIAVSKSGQFRVRCWKFLEYEPQTFSFILNGPKDSLILDMSALRVNIRQWNPLRDYISVQVRALDGPNKDFVFGAIGQGQRNDYPNTTYGGVRFAYSKQNIAIFLPVLTSGSIINVPENWGPPQYNQMSNDVEITVRIWNTTSDGKCSTNRYSGWTFPRYKYFRSFDYWIKCSALCLSEPSCVGFIPSRSEDHCQSMDLNMVNNRTLAGVLGNESEAILTKVACDSLSQ